MGNSNALANSATNGVDLKKLREPFPREEIKQRIIGGGRKAEYLEGSSVIRRLNAAAGAWDFRIIKEWQDGDILKALGEITIPGLGSRQHIGVQKIAAGGGEDLHKGHVTDALKKAATLFGVGLEVYGPDEEGSYPSSNQYADLVIKATEAATLRDLLHVDADAQASQALSDEEKAEIRRLCKERKAEIQGKRATS